MRKRTLIKAFLVVAVALGVAAVALLESLNFNTYKRFIAAQVEHATGRAVTLQGALRLDLFPVPALSVKGVTLANAKWGTRPAMLRIGELDAEVSLWPLLYGGRVDIRRLVLKNADLLLETDAQGRGNWMFGAPPKAARRTDKTEVKKGGLASPEAIPILNHLAVRNLKVTYRNGVSGTTYAATLADLSASANDGGPILLSAHALYRGLPIQLTATVGPPGELLDRGRPYPVDGQVSFLGMSARVLGSLSDPLEGRGLNLNFSFEGRNLATLSTALDHPVHGVLPYRFAVTLVGDLGGKLDLQGLQINLGQSALAGDGTLWMGGERPRIKAKLTSSLIDFRPFFGAGPALPEPLARAVRGKNAPVFSAQPWPLDVLGMADADITLNAGRLIFGKWNFNDVATHVVLANRNLRLASFSAGVAGGKVSATGSLAAAANPATLRLDGQAKGIDLALLAKTAKGEGFIEAGRGNLDVAVNGEGDSTQRLMADLNGNVDFVVDKSRLGTRVLDLIGAGLIGEISDWISGNSGSALNCAVGRFDIHHGIATADGLLADTDKVTVRGTGTVNLGAETLDLTLSPRPKRATLVSLAIPIDVGGTFRAPSFTPSKLALAKDVAGAVVGTAINPLGVFVPLVSGGTGVQNPCVAALAALRASEQSKGRSEKTGGHSGGGLRGFFHHLGSSLSSTLHKLP